MIKLLVTYDNRVFLDGLVLLLEQSDDYLVIGTASNGNELVDHKELRNADVLLVDLEMPVINGLQSVKRIQNDYPEKIAVAVSMYHEKVYLADLAKYGFRGFVNKSQIVEDLFKVLREVVAGVYGFENDLNIEK